MRPRAISIDDAGDFDQLPRGQVVVVESGRYDVLLESDGGVVACRLKRGVSSENDQSTIAVVGDYVRVQPLEGERGLIHHIEERRTRLGRDAVGNKGMEHVIAANVDILLCIISADRPDFRRTIVDRYIVSALIGDVEPVVVTNKIDMVDGELEELLREEVDIYKQLGYRTLFTSTVTNEGIDELRELIAGRVSVLSGQSGVGKSSIANVILGGTSQRIGDVRERDRRGTHTTVSSSMLKLHDGGYLVDTPGLREFGLWDLLPEELDGYFVEFLDFNRDCRFLPCTHTHEPDCAVIAAVERGEIDAGRYASYLSIFGSLGTKKNNR